MLRYDTVLFDLDGTLMESGTGVFYGINGMLADRGREPMAFPELHPFIGPPLRESFETLLGIPHAEIEAAMADYRRHYDEGGHCLIKPFPGAVELLRELRLAGVRVGIVTSRTETSARAQLEQFGFWPSISYLGGIREDRVGNKQALLERAVRELGLDKSDFCRVAMVGDRCFDMQAAAALGMDAIGVAYGYGGSGELLECHPAALVGTVEELGRLLLGGGH